MSETFTFDVNYSTSFEDIEILRQKMLKFLEGERRDYQPVFDVAVVGLCLSVSFSQLSLTARLRLSRARKGSFTPEFVYTLPYSYR